MNDQPSSMADELDAMEEAAFGAKADELPGGEAALRLSQLHEQKAELEARLKAVTEEIKNLSSTVMGWMIDNQQQRGTWAGRTLYLKESLYARAKPEALADGSFEEAIERFIREYDLTNLDTNFVQKTVNSNVLSAFVREVVKRLREEADARKKEVKANTQHPHELIYDAVDILPQYVVDVMVINEVQKVESRKSTRHRTT